MTNQNPRISAWVEQEAGGSLPLVPTLPSSLDQAGLDNSWENAAQSLRLDFFWAPTVNETLLEVSISSIRFFNSLFFDINVIKTVYLAGFE